MSKLLCVKLVLCTLLLATLLFAAKMLLFFYWAAGVPPGQYADLYASRARFWSFVVLAILATAAMVIMFPLKKKR